MSSYGYIAVAVPSWRETYCVRFIVGSTAKGLGTVLVCPASVHSPRGLSENTWDSLESMVLRRGPGSLTAPSPGPPAQMDVIKSYIAPLWGVTEKTLLPCSLHTAVILSHGRFLIFLRVGCPSSSLQSLSDGSGPSSSQSSLVDLLTQGREKQAASYLLRACCAPGHRLVLERPQVLTC